MSAGARAVAIYFAASGLILVALGLMVAFAGWPFPFSFASIPLGVVGLVASGTLASLPIAVGTLFLLIATGLWGGRAWAAWTALVFSAIGILLAFAAYLSISVSAGIPIVGQYFSAYFISLFSANLPFIALAAVINFGVISVLAVDLHKGELQQ